MGGKAGSLEEAKEREKGECFSQSGLCVMDCWVLLNYDGGAGGGKGQETLYPPTPPILSNAHKYKHTHSDSLRIIMSLNSFHLR